MSNDWSFTLGRIRVTLDIRPDYGYQYDGDDEDGEVQAKLDSGEFVAFNSQVSVEVDGHVMGTDYLVGSVYDADEVNTFYTAHRDPDPRNRNSTANPMNNNPSMPGRVVHIGHYFPDMVHQAIAEARKELTRLQSFKVRQAN